MDAGADTGPDGGNGSTMAVDGSNPGPGNPPGQPSPQACADVECLDDNACNGIESCPDGPCLRGERAVDGSECPAAGGLGVCNAGNCTRSFCGDRIVDERNQEQCDDGNGDDTDGCTATCRRSCETAPACQDGNTCNGAETCELATYSCAPGVPAENGTACGDGLVCRAGLCVPSGCGNLVVDAGEECDDGNLTRGDGCENDCSFSCESDSNCTATDACNTQQCNMALHVCMPAGPLDCDDQDDCTDNTCDPAAGCSFPLIDRDGDGHAPTSLGGCGDDCDDSNESIHAGAAELCDQLDNDCDDAIDEVGPIWYLDCDGDGFAPLGAEPIQQCEPPPPAASRCPAGSVRSWTTRTPADQANADCQDGNPSVFPKDDEVFHATPIPGVADATADYDYDCRNGEEHRWPLTEAEAEDCGLLRLGACGGGEAWAGGLPECRLFDASELPLLSRCSGALLCTRQTTPTQPECR
jgi:cysteine-rich repeat protein